MDINAMSECITFGVPLWMKANSANLQKFSISKLSNWTIPKMSPAIWRWWVCDDWHPNQCPTHQGYEVPQSYLGELEVDIHTMLSSVTFEVPSWIKAIPANLWNFSKSNMPNWTILKMSLAIWKWWVGEYWHPSQCSTYQGY